jgi:hypothetical protein
VTTADDALASLRQVDGFECLIHVLVFREPPTLQIAKCPEVATASIGLDAALPSDASGANSARTRSPASTNFSGSIENVSNISVNATRAALKPSCRWADARR